MVAGAPFPDLLEWTWGEICEFIICKNEARQRELREQANMDFRQAMLICKAFNAKKGAKFSVMEEYDFLWSKEEQEKAAIERFEQQMMALCKKEE